MSFNIGPIGAKKIQHVGHDSLYLPIQSYDICSSICSHQKFPKFKTHIFGTCIAYNSLSFNPIDMKKILSCSPWSPLSRISIFNFFHQELPVLWPFENKKFRNSELSINSYHKSINWVLRYIETSPSSLSESQPARDWQVSICDKISIQTNSDSVQF